MTSSEIVAAYLTARRAQGVQLKSAARTLRQFVRVIDNRSLDALTSQDIAAFLQGRGALSGTWRTRRSLLTGLYRFAVARGYAFSSPLPELLPKLPPSLTPYVYSREELQRLFSATAILDSPWSRLQADTYRTLLLLLYGAGLRVSEAIGLKLRDVDLSGHVLTVRNSKFYKSRLVPVGPQLVTALNDYLDRRSNLPFPEGPDSSFLCSRSGCRLYYQRVVTLFQRVRAAANIPIPAGERRPPRLHDLRHTAAVHRVLHWYRTGKNVQALLPHLATYLGHVDIRATQRYLQMTPELLQEASYRFAIYARQTSVSEADDA
ncbi:tyrosine-type recombinase/integrase [Paraburkholderia sabiae]|uniref:tyrosine-type recombinase/integrase n=1 Tax=Paraburkholderia sabiae TaxID=273251 RepID=UPI00191B474A|nr:tyrosine-type recombinase/integrase [Paraburkholderia sabiae]CAD6563426.1 Tyrosine recombinase XerD [Paraburkholderia sabiae]